MQLGKICIFFFICLAISSTAFSQDAPVFEVTSLTDHIYELTTDGGGYTVKVIASFGPDGLLIIDAGQDRTFEALKKAIGEIGQDIPDVIIASHSHGEHVGGIAGFGPSPIVIGQSNVRQRLRSGSYLFDEYPDHALPEVMFDDSLTLFFNGEPIKLVNFGGAHDNSDIIVWFTESKLAFVGALYNGTHWPSVDEATGDVLKYAETTKRVIDYLPDDVKIISGHGEDGTVDDFKKLQATLAETQDIARVGVEAGKDYDKLVEEDVYAKFASYDGGYVNRNDWLKYHVDALNHEDGEKKKDIYADLYYALKDGGVDALVATYEDIHANHADEYDLNDISLLAIAYRFYQKKQFEDATRLFELSVRDFPDGEYAWLCYHNLGKMYKDSGKIDMAVMAFKKSLELNPENTRAQELLGEIEKEG